MEEAGFRVGIVVGVLVGLAISAVFAHRKGHRWRRNILGFLSLAGFGFLGFAIYLAVSDSAAHANENVDKGLRAGCQSGCTQSGGPADLCEAYCGCILGELHARHSDEELNDLVVAASRDQSSEAMAAINAPSAGSLARIEEEASRSAAGGDTK